MYTLIQKTYFLVSFHAVAFAVFSAAFGAMFLKMFSINQPLMFSVADSVGFSVFYEFSLIVLFFVSLHTSNSSIMTSARSPQQESRWRVHWDNDILSSKDLKT